MTAAIAANEATNATSTSQSNRDLAEGKNSMMNLLQAFVFLESLTHKGLTHFVNIYLVVIVRWTPMKASWIWFARDIVRLIFQIALSARVERVERKKLILVMIGLQKLVAGVIMLTSTNFALQLVKGITDGFTAAAVLPTITAITLRVMGGEALNRKHAALNMMVQYLGISLSAILFGCVAYLVYPKVENMFYQNIIVAALCLGCVALMPLPDGSINTKPRQKRTPSSNKPRQRRQVDPEDTITLNSSSEDLTQSLLPSPSSESRKNVTYREDQSDPSKRRSLFFLSMVYFSFHLVNATILPLLGQYMGLQSSPRYSLPIFTVLLVTTELGSFLSTWAIRNRLDSIGYRNALFVACGALGLRLMLITVSINLTDNLWLLGSTNILGGLSTGIANLMLALYSHTLSEQNGNYNVNMETIAKWETMGSALSIVLGGALATNASYQTAFLILTGMIMIPALSVFGVDTSFLTANRV